MYTVQCMGRASPSHVASHGGLISIYSRFHPSPIGHDSLFSVPSQFYQILPQSISSPILVTSKSHRCLMGLSQFSIPSSSRPCQPINSVNSLSHLSPIRSHLSYILSPISVRSHLSLFSIPSESIHVDLKTSAARNRCVLAPRF